MKREFLASFLPHNDSPIPWLSTRGIQGYTSVFFSFKYTTIVSADKLEVKMEKNSIRNINFFFIERTALLKHNYQEYSITFYVFLMYSL